MLKIEKELLGLVFACEKFHEYVYGATVIGETDHKPLVSLHKKNLCDLTVSSTTNDAAIEKVCLDTRVQTGKIPDSSRHSVMCI